MSDQEFKRENKITDLKRYKTLKEKKKENLKTQTQKQRGSANFKEQESPAFALVGKGLGDVSSES